MIGGINPIHDQQKAHASHNEQDCLKPIKRSRSSDVTAINSKTLTHGLCSSLAVVCESFARSLQAQLVHRKVHYINFGFLPYSPQFQAVGRMR
ncbi:Uncharacterized protein HZ326_6727 [Fusarium oxysporum f. sp. albedinis]|nr:Uncharacterized protein HZ326_6727 [Fusarium oxysporum f. sp. albedinis]